MIRFLTPLFALSFVLPIWAEEEQLPPADIAQQNLAIVQSVQEQLLSCWSLPSGYADKRFSVRLTFLSDGSLYGEPTLAPESERLADKYPALARSIGRAIFGCVPFAGLEALGAVPGERFDITVHFQS